jgi:serine/threonine protein kinase
MLCMSFSLQRIGEGSYGAVYKALDKRDGSLVAVKALAIDTADANTLQKEIHILQTCASPHIVNYKGSYVKDNDLWVGGTHPPHSLVCGQ